MMAHEQQLDGRDSVVLTARDRLGRSHTAGGKGVSKLADQVAAGLRAEAAELTARWKAQARSHAPRAGETGEPPGEELDASNAQTIVGALADAVAGGASWQTDLMRQ